MQEVNNFIKNNQVKVIDIQYNTTSSVLKIGIEYSVMIVFEELNYLKNTKFLLNYFQGEEIVYKIKKILGTIQLLPSIFTLYKN